MRRGKNKHKQAQGIVSQCSSRIARSGSHAHSFLLGKKRYTVFSDDNLSPVTEGDNVIFDYEERTLKSGYRARYNAVVSGTLVIQAPAEIGQSVEGLVYILSNPSMPGLLKVGYTTGSATRRAEELSRVTSIPTGFKVEWTLPVYGDPRAVEQSAHAHLAKSRHGKEFFRVSLETAKDACIGSFAKLYPEKASLMDGAFASRAENELKRREKLAQLAVKHEEEKQAEKDRIAYEQSDKGLWRSKGICRMVAHSFAVEPERASPTLIRKLFGMKFEDFMEFNIKPAQYGQEIQWSVSMSGRKLERAISDHKYLPTQAECLAYVSTSVHAHGIPNYRTTISIPNALLENPPMPRAFPGNYMSEAVLLVETMDDLVIRPNPAARK